MESVNKTLYIPLYGKATVSKQGIILNDPKAEAIWAETGIKLRGKAKSNLLAYYMAMRARVFDDWTSQQLTSHPGALVLHIGCGLDSRVERINASTSLWVDVDFPAVIEERKRFFSESDHYQMLSADASSTGWIKALPKSQHAIIVMEGLSMYLTNQQLQNLFLALQGHFEHIFLLMDCYSAFAARVSKVRNPVNTVGAKIASGFDDPRFLEQNPGIRYSKELSMCTPELIALLGKFEQFMFRWLLDGKFARSVYRLYEFEIKTYLP